MINQLIDSASRAVETIRQGSYDYTYDLSESCTFVCNIILKLMNDGTNEPKVFRDALCYMAMQRMYSRYGLVNDSKTVIHVIAEKLDPLFSKFTFNFAPLRHEFLDIIDQCIADVKNGECFAEIPAKRKSIRNFLDSVLLVNPMWKSLETTGEFKSDLFLFKLKDGIVSVYLNKKFENEIQ